MIPLIVAWLAIITAAVGFIGGCMTAAKPTPPIEVSFKINESWHQKTRAEPRVIYVIAPELPDRNPHR